MENNKSHQIIKVILLALAVLLTAIGCEREFTESSKLTESSKQTQSFNEAAPASTETEELGVIIERNVPVPMRDGTILRADVHRPDRGGPYPVLVQRTPYGKGGNFDRFVKAGYIVVSQDVRGRYESGGTFESLDRLKTHDAEDGYDTIEWAAKLSGSNGNVGTFGISYEAFLQWRLAPLRPPTLVAMSASGVAARHYLQEIAALPGGIVKWWVVDMAPEMRRRARRPGVNTTWEARRLWDGGEWRKWINFLPRLELPQEFCEDEIEAFRYLLKNPHIDPWRLDERCKDIAVPNLEIVGWYDLGTGDVRLYRTLARKGKTEVVRKGSKIVIGPWIHGGSRRKYGDIDFGPDASLDRIAMQIRWFDYWLKGRNNGIEKDYPVKIFLMGDNKWRDEQSWPLNRARNKVLFLTSEGHANTPRGNGQLISKRQQSPSKDQYLYDPQNPISSLWDWNSPILGGPIDRRPLDDREDILVYNSEPLAERIEVTGSPVVELYASSSAPDTDWFVWLIDVSPSGRAMEVSGGRIRARYREGFTTPKLINPAEVVKYTIRMEPTSIAFLPGHRIRLDISSSDFPNYDYNHNTATNSNFDATMKVAKQTIYHGSDRAARIILPWVPNPPEEDKPIEKEKVEQESEKRIYPLHQAAVDGDIEQVKQLISKGVNVNAKDEEENPPLHYAVQSGKIEIVQLLVEAGADVNVGSLPPLCEAVDKNDITIAKYLISHGANVNVPEGWIALQETPYVGNNIEMVELLIASGADVNAGDWTPLHGAANEGRRDIADLLVQKGANVNAKDKSGYTPLYYSTQNHDLDMIKLLVAKGADIKAIVTPKGLTLLHYMSTYDSPDIIEKLLSKGAKVDERDDNYEFTALHYAARFGSTKVAEVLIAHGADIRAKDKWGYEPIHWAAYHDRPDIIELLIAKGADVNAKTSLGQTPLDLAIPRRNTGAIEVLLKHGSKE